MAGRWKTGTVDGNDGARVKVWKRGQWMIAQDVNVGALAGERRDRWGYTLQWVMENGDEVPADVHTQYGTACWDTRAEAVRVSESDPPLLDAATADARHRAAVTAALNARVRALSARLRDEPAADGGGAHRATEPEDALADLDALAEYLGARRRGVAAVAAALMFACESEVDVEDHDDRIVLTFDVGREWEREVAFTWPTTERRWQRDVGRADEACTDARERSNDDG